MMLTTDFILRNTSLTWSDVLWGYTAQLIGWRVPIEIAAIKVSEGHSSDLFEIQLSDVGKDDDWRVRELLEALAGRERESQGASKGKWLFLVLLWLYENRESEEDVLATLGTIYADFDYPDEICSFIPFMPPRDAYRPSEHTPEENRDRIFEKWKEYLDARRLHMI